MKKNFYHSCNVSDVFKSNHRTEGDVSVFIAGFL